jgi:hypothetical protein
VIRAGNTTELTAFARGINGGFSDPDQSKAAYLMYGRSLFRCGYKAQGNGNCVSNAALLPRFHFYSENPDVADFVKRDPIQFDQPRKDGGQLERDPGGESGLLCVFKLGKVGINAVAGMHRARMVIEGVPGNGRCIDAAVQGVRLLNPPPPVKEPPTIPGDEPRVFHHFRPNQQVIVVFPPPPAPVVAPAPPGAPGVGRKEEHEVEFETEGHEHQFTALAHARERRGAVDAAWPILGGVAMMAFFGAVVAAAERERRRPAWAREVRR